MGEGTVCWLCIVQEGKGMQVWCRTRGYQCEAFYSGEGSKIGNLQNRGKRIWGADIVLGWTALRVQTVQDRTFGRCKPGQSTDMLILHSVREYLGCRACAGQDGTQVANHSTMEYGNWGVQIWCDRRRSLRMQIMCRGGRHRVCSWCKTGQQIFYPVPLITPKQGYI